MRYLFRSTLSANSLYYLHAVRDLIYTIYITCRRSLIACIGFSVIACALVGCHGGPDTDIIERELRWHEDQIYALEDYLMEYQAKVRRLREENATLSQALAETKQKASWHNDSLLPEPASPLRRRSSSKTLKPRTSAPKSEAEEIKLPDVPGLDTPSVPPLGPEPSAASGSPGTAWVTKTTAYKPPAKLPIALPTEPAPPLAAEPNAPWAAVVGTEPITKPITEPAQANPSAIGWIQSIEPAPVVQASVVEETVQAAGWIGEAPWISSVAEPLPMVDEVDESEPMQRSGIVLVDATPVLSHRPRMMLLEVEIGSDGKSAVVHVTPLADDHQRAAFEGSASLMFRDPEADPIELARWEYTAEEVADAWVSTPRGRVLEFELPLVESIPTEVPVELWVRMVPVSEDEISDDKAIDDGSTAPVKILDHMVLRLESIHGPTRIEMGNDWAVATPGSPQLLERPKAATSSQWRSTGGKAVR